LDRITPYLLDHAARDKFLAKLGSRYLGYKNLPQVGSREWQIALDTGELQAKLIQIGKCELDDLERLYKIEVLCFNERVRYSKGHYENLLKSRDVDSLRVAIGIEILAYVFWSNRTHEIITLNVHPKYRRMGLASIIMRLLENSVKKPTVLTLEVYERNHAAIRMYKKLGYRLDSITRNYYGKGSNALIMKKEL
jgi:ribosomal-protein-alanine N-acetyltransferase